MTRALYQRDLASPSPLSVSIQGAMYLRHHSLTYHLDSLMQSKASQEYQAQGDLGLGIILRHRGLWFGHSVVSDSATPWTAARQAPLSMGFSRQENRSGCPLPPPGDLPHPGIEPAALAALALAGRLFTTCTARGSPKAGTLQTQLGQRGLPFPSPEEPPSERAVRARKILWCCGNKEAASNWVWGGDRG